MKSRVAIADDLDIQKAVDGALGMLAGLPELIAGRHIAIKPNDTWASRQDLTACTQPDTLRAVIRHIKVYGPGKITVTGGAGAGETDAIFRLLGLDRVIKEEGVSFFDHNRPPFTVVRLEHGPQAEVMVNARLFDYDAVISLAQHKVHDIAAVTLTMKNIAMSYPAADYYGHPRSKRLHAHAFFEDMHGFIAGMCKAFRFSLGIIAGHPAMTGSGPIGGHVFDSGLVIAGTDFVAVDYIGARLLGFEKVGHISQAQALGLGNADLGMIEITGVKFEEAAKKFEGRRLGRAA